MKTILPTLALSLALAASSLSARLVTLIGESDVATIGENEVAEVLFADAHDASSPILINGHYVAPFNYNNDGGMHDQTFGSELGLVFKGPLTIAPYDYPNNPQFPGVVTLRISDASLFERGTSNHHPSTAAVIPAQASGDYDVILESSADMISWSPVNPGSYGGTDAAQFFRVRIVETTSE